jgi:hypothetical protein
MSISKAFAGSIPAMYGTGDSSTPPSNEVKKTASVPASYDFFGRSVAVGSGRIVVGAYSGSAYIFDLDGNQLTKLTAIPATTSDTFGYSVSIGNGRIVIGSYGDDDDNSNYINTGSAYVFDLGGNLIKKLTAINAAGESDAASLDHFGYSVAVGSGRIVVGSYLDDDAGSGSNSGSAYIFDLDGNLIKKLTASDAASNDYFGYSVAVGNGRIVVGAYLDDDAGSGSNSGSAYIFDLDGNQLTKLTASDAASNDYFGRSVAVGSGRIVVGAEGDDNDDYTNSGSAYIFDLDGNQLTKLTASDAASNDYFGNSVAVGSGRIVVGAYSGSAYIFDLDGNQLTKLTSSYAAAGDNFGRSVAVGNGRIVVGAYKDDNGDYTSSGSVYIYTTPNVITPYDVQDWERG